MATAQGNMEHAGLGPKVGCPACRDVLLPRMGYLVPTFLRSLELLWENIMPAPHCLLTVDARKLDADIFNLFCAQLTKHLGGVMCRLCWPKPPGLSALQHYLLPFCHCVSESTSLPLLTLTAHSLLRQARLLRKCHLLLTHIWSSWQLHAVNTTWILQHCHWSCFLHAFSC